MSVNNEFRYNRSQSLINQGNILTKLYFEERTRKISSVAIPYKSGKYSYTDLTVESKEVSAFCRNPL